MESIKKRSPGIHQNQTRPSDCQTVKRDLSIQRTVLHMPTQSNDGQIIGIKSTGWSTRRIAGQLDRSECAVRNCWEQWTREGTHVRKPGSGATRKTTRRDDRRIVRQALVDLTVTRSTI
ncbi:uncharacterized protein TNCV_2729101 [Trichonephila clavipes]|nr:uncharacterized protein TNCV_2729101 [Trichonephila clavipes]